MRKVLILGVALLVLATGALFLAPRFIDPGWYRDAITVELRRLTGREIVIAGPLVLSLLPNPGLIAEDVRLANPAGTAVPDMLRATRIDARLALLRSTALLTGKTLDQSLGRTSTVGSARHGVLGPPSPWRGRRRALRA